MFILMAGCAGPAARRIEICPGKTTIDQSLAALRSYTQNSVPLKASGVCKFEYYDSKGKIHKENAPIKLRTCPPDDFYFWADPIVMPKAVSGGANRQEFWLSVKLDPPSMYLWGNWPKDRQKILAGECFQQVWLGMYSLMDLFGMGSPRSPYDALKNSNWKLGRSGNFDILELSDLSGRLLKKLYIDSCDYKIAKIEQFNLDGKITAVTKLANYRRINENFFVPTQIDIVWLYDAEKAETVSIRLNSIGHFDISDEQKTKIFKRPEPKDIKNVYMITENCEMIRQPQ